MEQIKYNEVMNLHSKGLSNTKIAKIVGIDRHIIGYWIKFGLKQGTEKYIEYRKKHYETNKIEISKKAKEYCKINKVKLLKHKKEYYDANKIEILKQQKEHYETNKIDILKRQKEYYEDNKVENLKRSKKYREDNKDEISKKKKKLYQTLRCIVLDHYSHGTMSCAICGNNDIRVLELHHTNNDGTEDRKKYCSIYSFYLSLKKSGFPDGYEVLCSCHNHDKLFEWREYGTSKSAKVNLKLKTLVMSHYSQGIPQCSKCGDENLDHLTMDHKGGGGTKHRKEIGIGGFYRYLRKNNYPPIAQVLCYNCQRIKMVENSENRKKSLKATYPVGIQGRMYNGKKCLNKYMGVYKDGNRYVVNIRMNGRYYYLGSFQTPELAKQRYDEVKNGDWNGASLRENKRTRNGKLFASQCKGVSKHRDKWGTNIWINGKNFHLGTFSTEIEAAKAYDIKARELGRKTNFPIIEPAN